MIKDIETSTIIDLPWVACDTYILSNNGTIINKKTLEVKSTFSNSSGYRYVNLYDYKEGHNRAIAIHRLVAHYFVPKSKDDEYYNRNVVHFRDYDKCNIHAYNLQWVNRFELQMMNNYRDDLEHYEIRDCLVPICKFLEKGYDSKSIVDILGIMGTHACATITKIRKRQIYSDITKKYRF